MKRKGVRASLKILAVLLVVAFGYVDLMRIQHRNDAQQTINTPAKTVSQVATQPPTGPPPTKEELLRLVNAERAKYGAAPLTESPLLDMSAQWKADDETKYDYYGHTKVGEPGHSGLDYMESLNPPCSYLSENIDQNHSSAEAVSAWIKSPAHHKAMIDPGYTTTGFGISQLSYDNSYNFVEHFCRP